MADGVDRSTALIAVELVPVAGMRALEADDAGAALARRIAMDVGEPPFVADAAAVREQPRHPAFRRVAQAPDDQVDVVSAWRGGRGGSTSLRSMTVTLMSPPGLQLWIAVHRTAS